MNELLKCVLSLSLSGTVMIMLMFLCKPLFGTVTKKCWQYYLWLIVIARLLIPFAPKADHVLVFSPEGDRTVVQMTEHTDEYVPSAVLLEENGEEADGFQSVAAAKDGNAASLWDSKALEAVAARLWLVWLAGAVILFMRRIIGYRRFVKGVWGSACLISDSGLLDLLSECGEQVGVKCPVELAVNKAVSSPMLIGCFHPCILLPTVDIPVSDLRYIFLHELTHERRQDIFYKWLVQFTFCVHWFNPFVWLMSREIDRACELACDEAVISRLRDEERIEYGDMLLNAVRLGGIHDNPTAFTALYESKKMMKERLVEIMKFRKRTKWLTFASLSLAICLLAVSMVEGAYLMPSITDGAKENGSHETGDAFSHAYGTEDAGNFENTDAAGSDKPTGGWESGNSIDEAAVNFTIDNECSGLGEEQVAYISNTVVQNVLEGHEGVYSFDNMEVRLYRQMEDDEGLVVDVEVGAIMTLIRAPEDAPYVQGMKAVLEEFRAQEAAMEELRMQEAAMEEELRAQEAAMEEMEAARQVLEAYRKEAEQYYNAPGSYATGFCYRVYVSANGAYKFYHMSGPDEDPDLTEMSEHETFTEIFTEEDGREYMREEVRRIMAETA